jgi:hypothetical protein
MYTLLRTTFLLALSGILVGAASGQTPTTTIQNGNADTRLQLNYDGGLYVPGTFDPAAPADSIPATGAGTRLMWYPAKAAFRAGRVFDINPSLSPDYLVFWDPQNVGKYSTAFGVNTKASGFASTAAGSGTKATGDYSVAIGRPGQIDTEVTTASGAAAVAMGEFAEASGDYSVALNRGTKATDNAATAMGDATEASAFAATAMGLKTAASASRATAMGFETTASGAGSTAMGERTTAATENSLSVGAYNDANRGNDDNDPETGPLLVVGNGSPGTRSDALSLDSNGDLEISGTLTESSDRRLKTSIRPLKGETMAKLLRLRPVRYQFKNQKTHPAGEQIGLVAQDVRTEFPALVSGENGDALSLSYSKFTAVLLKGLQEQQAELEAKEDDIATLKAENEEFEERLAALERQNASALPAGLTGPWALTLLLGLGALGAGLLWRSRPSALS